MSRRVRTGPVYLEEIKFAKTARGDHFQNQKMITSRHYDMYVSADTLPGFVVCTSKMDRDFGSVYILPYVNIESAQVAERSLTIHQPLGTSESHDTPSGSKKKGSMPPRSNKGRPIGTAKKANETKTNSESPAEP